MCEALCLPTEVRTLPFDDCWQSFRFIYTLTHLYKINELLYFFKSDWRWLKYWKYTVLVRRWEMDTPITPLLRASTSSLLGERFGIICQHWNCTCHYAIPRMAALVTAALLEINQMSIHTCMNKQIVSCLHNKMLLSTKKNRLLVAAT